MAQRRAQDIRTAAGASRTRRRHVDSVRNDINVTPLVDVMLVLLIIFMLMTLIMGRGHDVNLPKAQQLLAGEGQDAAGRRRDRRAERRLCSTSRRTSSAPINEATLKEMGEQIEAAWKAPKNPDGVGRIYIKADADRAVRQVYPVLMYLNKRARAPADRPRDREGRQGEVAPWGCQPAATRAASRATSTSRR